MRYAAAGVLVAWITVSLGVASAQTADATKVTVSLPATIASLDAGKLKGDLTKLAWSPDGASCYLQTVERDTRGNVSVRHYLFELTAQQPKAVDEEPAWAAAYWTRKSSQSAPGLASLRIAIDQQQRLVSGAPPPKGGDLAKGGLGPVGGASGGMGGTSVGDATSAAFGSQNVSVTTLRLKGEVVGEFVNAPALPGTTFGWGPSASGLIAFVRPDGRLVLMDAEGRTQAIVGPKAPWLPGWSEDGTSIRFLERTGRKKFAVQSVIVTVPRS